jgi:carbamoyltransferase
MRILGISAFYHDSAAALVEDGLIVAAAQEERFTRVKHDASFPRQAVNYCLAQGGGAPDAVVYYEKPLVKFERILSTAFAVAPAGFRAFSAAIPAWLRQKLWIPAEIEDAVRAAGYDAVGRIFFTAHHEAHAASAFFPSPFERAAILTLDAVGEWSTATLGRGAGSRLELLRELRFPHSLGLLYSAFTYFCGFRVNSGEYKLMGLAPYGEPRYRDLILQHLVDLRPDGSFRLNLDYLSYLHGERMTGGRFAQLFGGPPRAPGAALTSRECDLARSIQDVTEEIVLRMARGLQQETGESNLCLAGGVALNCVANGRLLREGPFARIWVQPAAGDAGGALGAALAFYHGHHGASRTTDGVHDSMRGAFLGPSYDDDTIASVLAERGVPAERLAGPDAVARRVAERVAAGEVVGVFQGRAEFGPRALGARSILADARSPDMQRRLNLKVKFRESFRPFAPVVLAECVTEYFDLSAPSPYMLFTAPVRKARRRPASGSDGSMAGRLQQIRSDIPAVTHIDYSARVQTVDRAENPFLHAVLTEFDRMTGCPVMINTSFNVRGEPPVGHPREALDGFFATGMDTLALGSFLIEKRSLPPVLLNVVAPARTFVPD